MAAADIILAFTPLIFSVALTGLGRFSLGSDGRYGCDGIGDSGLVALAQEATGHQSAVAPSSHANRTTHHFSPTTL